MFFKKKYETVEFSELKLVNKLNLIDVRDGNEYAKGSVKGAKNIEFIRLVNHPQTFLKQEKEYYLFCQNGMRSASACRALSKKGYKVYHIKGGLNKIKENK
ncbi:MAG: rhodanese-like domain-containing protein [Mycoplasmatales bacterium]